VAPAASTVRLAVIVALIAVEIAAPVAIAAAAEIVDRVAMAIEVAIATAGPRPAETAEICRYHRRRFYSAW